MHKKRFWEKIPTARLDNVSDHTNGHYVFDDPNALGTLKQIHRVLKAGGCFTLAHPADDTQTQILAKAGFKAEKDSVKLYKI